MLNSLKKIFEQSKKEQDSKTDDLHLLCGLMVEAANIDGVVDQEEINQISNLLISVFNEDPLLVKEELEKCLKELNEPKSLHFFTSQINKSFTNSKKITLIEVLWQIILEDGKVHDFESNLIRRLAGLLYISDYDCGKAKKKILENLKLNG